MRVEERRPERVFELSLPQTQAVAQPANDVRRLAHALHAAGEHDVRFAELDELRAVDGGLDAGAAKAIHRERRHLDRQPRPEAHVTRAVDGVRASLHDVAEHYMIDRVGLHTRPLHRRARRDGAQLDG